MKSREKQSTELRGFLHHLAAERGLSANTVAAYRRDLTHHLNWLEERAIGSPCSVLPGHVEEYLETLRLSGLRLTSLSRKASVLRTFYAYLEDEKVIAENPAEMVKLPRRRPQFKSALERDEVQRLLDYLSSQPEDALRLRDEAIVELLYATGLRVSELVNLRPGDVDLQHNYLRTLGKVEKKGSCRFTIWHGIRSSVICNRRDPS